MRAAALTAVFVLFASLPALPAQRREPAGGARTQRPRAETIAERTSRRCVEAATARAQARRRAGMSEARAERLYQAELAGCHDTRTRTASLAFAGASNVDYYRLARLFATRQLSASDYLARVRDRTRKLRAILRDPALLRAVNRGDRDGDLVPDPNDRCPDTPDLAPTDDRGCPDHQQRPTRAPETNDVLAILEKLRVAATPACEGAPVPTRAEPIRAGVDPADPNAFLISVTRVTNQPAGCPFFYEVDFRLSEPDGNLAPVIVSETVFRHTEGTAQAGPPASLLLRTSLLDPPHNQGDELGLVGHFFDVYAVREWRVRVVNGGGLSSGWSRWQRQTNVKF